jgi:hypothetical protein
MIIPNEDKTQLVESGCITDFNSVISFMHEKTNKQGLNFNNLGLNYLYYSRDYK